MSNSNTVKVLTDHASFMLMFTMCMQKIVLAVALQGFLKLMLWLSHVRLLHSAEWTLCTPYHRKKSYFWILMSEFLFINRLIFGQALRTIMLSLQQPRSFVYLVLFYTFQMTDTLVWINLLSHNQDVPLLNTYTSHNTISISYCIVPDSLLVYKHIGYCDLQINGVIIPKRFAI